MKNKKLASVLFSLAAAILFSLIFYAFTTPLGPSIGSDNAMYMTMGTALAQGYAPYTEIFDHKGPLVYLLQWLPQEAGGGYNTLTLFVQQVVFLFSCLRILDAICQRAGLCSAAVQTVYLTLICSLTGGGNLTEEYACVFTLAGILLILHVFGDGLGSARGLFPRAALLGAMAMLAFLTRANNALVLCAMTLALAASLLLARRYAQLLACAGGFIAGMAAAALPVCLWLLNCGALGEAIYGSIIHNMMYAETGSASRLDMLFHSGYGRCAILMAALTCLGALSWLRRSAALSFAMAAGAAAAGLAAFISHKFYDHYLILGAPLAAVGAGMALSFAAQALKKIRPGALAAAVMAVCLIWLGTNAKKTNDWRLADLEGYRAMAPHAQELYAMVPEEDKDSFMAYRVEPMWYVAAQALPSMRFYFLQEVLADADPAVMDEIVSTFTSDPPRWLVIYYNREFGPPYDARVEEIFKTRYEFVASSGTYQLLRHKEM